MPSFTARLLHRKSSPVLALDPGFETSMNHEIAAEPLREAAPKILADDHPSLAEWTPELVREVLLKTHLPVEQMQRVVNGLDQMILERPGYGKLVLNRKLLVDFAIIEPTPTEALQMELSRATFRGHAVGDKSAALLIESGRLEAVRKAKRPGRTAARQAAIATCRASTKARGYDRAVWRHTFESVPMKAAAETPET